MGDAAQVMKEITRKQGVSYPVLAPNVKGLEAAIRAGVREVAVFPAATEMFSKRNLNCSVEESLGRFGEVCARALEEGILVRG